MNIQNGKTYRLTQDFKNPNPDRRQKRDWRALPVVPAGTLLRGSKLRGARDGEVYASLYNGYRHHDVTAFAPEWDALLAVLEEVTDFDAQLFELRERFAVAPEELLAQLVKAGHVSFAQLEAAARQQETDDDAADAAKETS